MDYIIPLFLLHQVPIIECSMGTMLYNPFWSVLYIRTTIFTYRICLSFTMADWHITHPVYSRQYNLRWYCYGSVVLLSYIRSLYSNSTIISPARFSMTCCHAWTPSQQMKRSYKKRRNNWWTVLVKFLL